MVQGDPTCLRATRPVSHNYWASALELQQEKPLQGAARTRKLETTALTTTREKPACSNRDLPGKKNPAPSSLGFLPSICLQVQDPSWLSSAPASHLRLLHLSSHPPSAPLVLRFFPCHMLPRHRSGWRLLRSFKPGPVG